MAINDADRAAMNAEIANARAALTQVEADVNNPDNIINFPGGVVGIKKLQAAVDNLALGVNKEYGEANPS